MENSTNDLFSNPSRMKRIRTISSPDAELLMVKQRSITSNADRDHGTVQ